MDRFGKRKHEKSWSKGGSRNQSGQMENTFCTVVTPNREKLIEDVSECNCCFC